MTQFSFVRMAAAVLRAVFPFAACGTVEPLQVEPWITHERLIQSFTARAVISVVLLWKALISSVLISAMPIFVDCSARTNLEGADLVEPVLMGLICGASLNADLSGTDLRRADLGAVVINVYPDVRTEGMRSLVDLTGSHLIYGWHG